ncbi:alcohol dehydrogenase [Diaporthe sp. PMI_573]|nr:alcohol dehydrogenase [Diaporthaceae sp. PMI_573]
MKEAIVLKGLEVNIIDTKVSKPKNGQVLIRVVVAGCNPKDWKQAGYTPQPSNSGDDLAGIVESMFTPHGAFAEYAIAWAYATFHIPNGTTFEEAATLPLASMTGALGVYRYLEIPLPWMLDDDSPDLGPILIYGAGAAVGAYAVQWARKSRAHPIICVAGQSKAYVKTIIDESKGDVVIDYRNGNDYVVSEIKQVLAGKPLLRAFDVVSEHDSDKLIGKVIDPNGRLTIVLPKIGAQMPKSLAAMSAPEGIILPQLEGVSENVQTFFTGVNSVFLGDRDFGFLLLQLDLIPTFSKSAQQY